MRRDACRARSLASPFCGPAETSRNVAKGWASSRANYCVGRLEPVHTAWSMSPSGRGSLSSGSPTTLVVATSCGVLPVTEPAEASSCSRTSLDASMDRGKWAPNRLISVRQYAEAVAILRTAGVPAKLWSLDCDSFYRKMGRQLCEIWRLMCRAASNLIDAVALDQQQTLRSAREYRTC